jgi:hypothetical protein
MSFSRVKPTGWALYEVLTSPQMNQLDIDHARAIDGYAGGSYTPSTPILINGEVDINGKMEINASGDYGLEVHGDGTTVAVFAEAEGGQNATAIQGIGKGTGSGVHGTNESVNGFGVKGAVSAAGAIGVHGISTSEIGVKGEGDTVGVLGTGNAIGVEGIGTAGNPGIKGTGGDATDGHGVQGIGGDAVGAAGVYGVPSNIGGYGLRGHSTLRAPAGDFTNTSADTDGYAATLQSNAGPALSLATSTGPHIYFGTTLSSDPTRNNSLWLDSSGNLKIRISGTTYIIDRTPA